MDFDPAAVSKTGRQDCQNDHRTNAIMLSSFRSRIFGLLMNEL